MATHRCSTWLALLLLLGVLLPAWAGFPSPGAHAHNDYLHARPLQQALELGFDSVEADVHLRDGRLLVAHSLREVQDERTLDTLYLDPLRALHRASRLGSLWLLVDIKGDDEVGVAQALEEHLRPYAELLHPVGASSSGPLKVILTGHAPRNWVLEHPRHLFYLDGGLGDLGVRDPRIPWVSVDWKACLSWKGEGACTDAQEARIKDMAARAAAAGQQLRFWGGPDRPEVWSVLRRCGVQRIGTDHLAELAGFLQR